MLSEHIKEHEILGTSKDISDLKTSQVAQDLRIQATEAHAADTDIHVTPAWKLAMEAKSAVYYRATIAERDAITGLKEGDICRVGDDGSGKFASYIYSSSASWEILSKQDWENLNITWAAIIDKPDIPTFQGYTFLNRTADPDAPAAGYLTMFFKEAVAYVKDAAGSVAAFASTLGAATVEALAGEAEARTTADETLQANIDKVRNYLPITAFGSDITISAADANYDGFIVTGTLTANVNIIVPNTKRAYTVINATAGAFTLGIKTAASSAVFIRQGYIGHVAVTEDATVKKVSAFDGGMTTDETSTSDGEVMLFSGTSGTKAKKSGTLLSTITTAISTLQGYFTGGVARVAKTAFLGEYTGRYVLAFMSNDLIYNGVGVLAVGQNSSAGDRPTTEECNWIFNISATEHISSSAGYIRVIACPKITGDKRSYLITWLNGTWDEKWTQLTDASGNAVNANSLGGVAASSYALKTDTAPDSSKLGGKTYAQLFDANGNANGLAATIHAYTTEREFGTAYTNNSGKLMFVTVTASVPASSSLNGLLAYVGITLISAMTIEGKPSITQEIMVKLEVPSGLSYSVYKDGPLSKMSWVETY